MKYSYILFCILIVSVTHSIGSQVSIEQKIRQLKDSWYQKLCKLEELGIKIIEKNKLIVKLENNSYEIASESGKL